MGWPATCYLTYMGPPPLRKQALNLLWLLTLGMAIRTKIEQKDTHYGVELHVEYICQLLALPIKEKSMW